MIPHLDDSGLLPAGIHSATLEEVRDRFGRKNTVRRRLFKGLKHSLQNLRAAGVRRVYINGSFVTDKSFPKDVDGCWDAEESIDLSKLDPVFLDFDHARHRMKAKYGVDFFPANGVELGSGQPFLDFFQTDKDGQPKGILVIELEKEQI